MVQTFAEAVKGNHTCENAGQVLHNHNQVLMGIDERLDKINESIHEYRPMINGLIEDARSLEVRLRDVEIKAQTAAVEIKRLQVDVDAIGNKIRYSVPAAQDDPGHKPESVAAVLAFIAALPKYWHVILGVGSAIAGAIAVLTQMK